MITLFSALSLALMAAATPPAAAPPAAPAPALQSTAPVCQPAAAAVAPGVEGAELVFSFCQADCTEGADVSCSGTSCSAVDQNCSFGQQGYVQCDGNYTYCPACPPGGCTRFECRMGCSCPGGLSVCVDLETCQCECIYE